MFNQRVRRTLSLFAVLGLFFGVWGCLEPDDDSPILSNPQSGQDYTIETLVVEPDPDSWRGNNAIAAAPGYYVRVAVQLVPLKDNAIVGGVPIIVYASWLGGRFATKIGTGSSAVFSTNVGTEGPTPLVNEQVIKAEYTTDATGFMEVWLETSAEPGQHFVEIEVGSLTERRFITLNGNLEAARIRVNASKSSIADHGLDKTRIKANIVYPATLQDDAGNEFTGEVPVYNAQLSLSMGGLSEESSALGYLDPGQLSGFPTSCAFGVLLPNDQGEGIFQDANISVFGGPRGNPQQVVNIFGQVSVRSNTFSPPQVSVPIQVLPIDGSNPNLLTKVGRNQYRVSLQTINTPFGRRPFNNIDVELQMLGTADVLVDPGPFPTDGNGEFVVTLSQIQEDRPFFDFEGQLEMTTNYNVGGLCGGAAAADETFSLGTVALDTVLATFTGDDTQPLSSNLFRSSFRVDAVNGRGEPLLNPVFVVTHSGVGGLAPNQTDELTAIPTVEAAFPGFTAGCSDSSLECQVIQGNSRGIATIDFLGSSVGGDATFFVDVFDTNADPAAGNYIESFTYTINFGAGN